MAQCVHGHALCAQSRAFALGGGEVFGEAAFDSVAGERSAVVGGEHRVLGLALALAHPDLEHRDGLGGERADALFAALAQAPQVRCGTELQISAGESEQLRDAQAGLRGGE
jgi:hypothetical protein